MKQIACSVIIAASLVAGIVLAAPKPTTRPTTQPTTKPAADLPIEVQAEQAFARGDYSKALQLYFIVEKGLQNQPAKLGAVQEKIRVCQTQLLKNPSADLQALLNERPTDNSPEKRKPHAKPKDSEFYDVLVKDLGNFEYDAEKGGNIPSDVRALHGAKIRTRGFMIPLDQADNIHEFALVPSLFACCFGQPPQVQHTMVVKTPKNKAVAYFPEEIIVEGILRVEEKKEDGLILSVFEVDCTSVKPATK